MRSEAPAREGRSFIEAARRAQIVECAIETIASEGYAHASLARIAKRAGISKGVISYHFADKDELIQEVVDEVLDALDSYMRPLVRARIPSASAMLRTYIESDIAFMTAHRSYVLALVEVFNNAHRAQSEPLVDPKQYESGLMELEQILRRGQRSGEFRRFSTRMMAVCIRSAIDAVAPQMVTDPGLDLESYSRELATTFELATRANGNSNGEGS